MTHFASNTAVKYKVHLGVSLIKLSQMLMEFWHLYDFYLIAISAYLSVTIVIIT
jgi:hypothetical protein